MPQPALSLCSADHEKFMEEFRCQIRAYALNADTDQPFCGDKGSTVNTSRPLSRDFADLQALYCGIRDRKADAWVWGDEQNWYDFGQLAAAKVPFQCAWVSLAVSRQKGPAGEDFYPNPELSSRDPDQSVARAGGRTECGV